MGRPKKYATDNERKCAKSVRDKERYRRRLCLGSHFDRWQELQAQHELENDEDVAGFLIRCYDRLCTLTVSAPCPRPVVEPSYSSETPPAMPVMTDNAKESSVHLFEVSSKTVSDPANKHDECLKHTEVQNPGELEWAETNCNVPELKDCRVLIELLPRSSEQPYSKTGFMASFDSQADSTCERTATTRYKENSTTKKMMMPTVFTDDSHEDEAGIKKERSSSGSEHWMVCEKTLDVCEVKMEFDENGLPCYGISQMWKNPSLPGSAEGTVFAGEDMGEKDIVKSDPDQMPTDCIDVLDSRNMNLGVPQDRPVSIDDECLQDVKDNIVSDAETISVDDDFVYDLSSSSEVEYVPQTRKRCKKKADSDDDYVPSDNSDSDSDKSEHEEEKNDKDGDTDKCLENSDAVISNPYHCPECLKICVSEASLARHLIVHLRLKCKLCPDTEGVYKTKKELRAHMKEKHNTNKIDEDFGVCDICGKICLRGHLANHQLTHTDKEALPRYHCPQKGCKYFAVRKSYLASHLKVKHGKRQKQNGSLKSLNCDYCGKVFQCQWHKQKHLLSHTGEKPFKCDFPSCDLSFRTAYDLRRHKLRHSDSKPMSCELCDYTCRQRNSLNWHMNKKHSMVRAVDGFGRTFYKPSRGTEVEMKDSEGSVS